MTSYILPTRAISTAAMNLKTQALPQLPALGLVDNAKLRSAAVLDALANQLIGNKQISGFVVSRKGSAGVTVDRSVVDDFAARVDLVICGVGDCGACTACSVDDAVMMNAAGMRTAVIITEPFKPLADRILERHGSPPVEIFLVEHPLFSRGQHWIESVGSALGDRVATRFGLQPDALAGTGLKPSI